MYISLNMRKTEYLFIYLRAIYITFSHELSVCIFCQFFNWVFRIFLEFSEVPYISVISVLCMWYNISISSSLSFFKIKIVIFFCDASLKKLHIQISIFSHIVSGLGVKEKSVSYSKVIKEFTLLFFYYLYILFFNRKYFWSIWYLCNYGV